MSAGDMAISFTLRMRDQGSGVAARALEVVQKALEGVDGKGRSASDTAARVGQALKTLESGGASAGRAAATAAAGLDRLGSSRASDGLIQISRNADHATAALNRLQSAGSASMRVLQMAGKGMAAMQAVKYAAQQPIEQTMGYDRKLANLSNTAFSEKSPAERIAKMRELDSKIMGAVRSGGGTREAALATLESMVASGSKAEDAYGALPTVMKFATAANADPQALSKLITKAAEFGVKDRTDAGDMALRAGQLGGFELRDMARYMPEQMAIASKLGMRGDAGYRALLAANQAAMLTTSNPDTAGNNLVNLLSKVNASDTAHKAKALDINLSGTLAKAAGKGINGLDAFVGLVEQLVEKDAKFQALRKKAASASGEEKRAAYEAQLSILEGSVIGKIVEDRQALMALLGVMQQDASGDTAKMREQLRNSKGTGDAAFSVVAQTPSFKLEQAQQEKDAAMQRAMDKVNPMLGDLADKATELARRFPDLAAASWAATTAITAMAGAASLWTVAGKVLGGGGTGALATGAASAGTAGAAAVASLAAGAAVGTGLYNAGRGTKLGDGFGNFVLEVGAFFGSQKAREDLEVIRQLEAAAVAQQAVAQRLENMAAGIAQRPPIVVQLDGREIYSSVNEIATEQARRK